MLKRLHIFWITMLLCFPGSVITSCKITYSFTGANISTDVKTFSVAFFPNRAKLVNPTLSQDFTEALKDKLLRQTPLHEADQNGDLEFSGTITGYDIKPISIQKQDLAAQNRLTITVNVKYTNNKNHDDDFERTFSEYEDYDSTKILSAVEGELVPKIIDQLLEDIYNSTIANW